MFQRTPTLMGHAYIQQIHMYCLVGSSISVVLQVGRITLALPLQFALLFTNTETLFLLGVGNVILLIVSIKFKKHRMF